MAAEWALYELLLPTNLSQKIWDKILPKFVDTHANLGKVAQIEDLCIDIWMSVLTICLSTQITERQGKLANVLPSHCINLQFQV